MPIAKQILKADGDVAALHESKDVVKVLPRAETVAEKQDRILMKLEDAKHDFDTYALKCLLELAIQGGIPKEELEVFRAVLKDLYKKEFVQAELEWFVEACHLHEQGAIEKLTRSEKRLLVKRGNNLIKMGKRHRLPVQVLVEASKCLRKLIATDHTTNSKQLAIMEKLEDAKLDLDHYALKCLLELAVVARIPIEKLEVYRRIFKDLHKDAFVQAELEKLVTFLGDQREKLSRPEKRFFLVRGNNLVKVAKRMGMGNSDFILKTIALLEKSSVDLW